MNNDKFIQRKSVTPYKKFRFVIKTEGSKHVVGAVSAYHDPFVRGMWISRGHLVNEPTLGSMLSEFKSVDVYLFAYNSDKARKIHVEYYGIDWLPVDVDATVEGVALEWVLLKDAKYTECVDVEVDSIPGQASLPE